MIYSAEIKPRAIKDLRPFPRKDQGRILDGIETLRNNLEGDVKKLANFQPQYRLRVGNYRVLFDVEGDKVVVYRVKLRKDAYR